jgi:hypothetical protein
MDCTPRFLIHLSSTTALALTLLLIAPTAALSDEPDHPQQGLRATDAGPTPPQGPEDFGLHSVPPECTLDGISEGIDVPPPRGQDIPRDLPADEICLDALLPTESAYDNDAIAFGLSDGRAVTLVSEDHQVQSLYTPDGGITWDSEVLIDGVPDGLAFTFADAAFSTGGSVYMSYGAADPTGDICLRFVRSVDMGQTWEDPVDLIHRGDDTHGVSGTQIAVNDSGRVAVTYLDGWSDDPYTRVSSDHGVTWTTPVRLDPGVAEKTAAVASVDVAVDGAGVVHVAYSQDRDGTGNRIWYTRSTDGGATFEAEREFDSLLPSGGRTGSENPHMALASDGSLLLAFWDAFDGTADRLYVLRSEDAGENFSLTLGEDLTNTDTEGYPDVLPSDGSATVLVAVGQTNRTVSVRRSTDYGASFGSAQTVTTTAQTWSWTHTASDSWAFAWSDVRNDSYLGWMREIYVRVSTDDGVTWGAEERVSTGTVGTSQYRRPYLASVNSDDLLLVYRIDRVSNGRDFDVYSTRSAADPLNFTGNEQRIDSDARDRHVSSYNSVNVATDGVSHVYAAMQAIGTGPYPDVYVASSSDGGYTFGAVQRVNTDTAGETYSHIPQVAATSDGYVYAVWKHVTQGGPWQLRFNSSQDYGITWRGTDIYLGDPSNDTSFGSHPEFQIAALPGGTVYVVWSDGDRVRMARSSDGGDTFTTDFIDQGGYYNAQPSICAQGSQIVLVYKGALSVWGVVSDDGGATWGAHVNLRNAQAANNAQLPYVACGDGDKAVAVWIDARGGNYRIQSNRYDGTAWQTHQNLTAAPVRGQYYPEVEWVSATGVAVVFHEYDDPGDSDDLSVRTVASTDRGATWVSPVKLDDTDLRDGSLSVFPHMATDGAGNVWVHWREHSAGANRPGIAVRHSSDGGQTWAPVYRADREEPQGYYSNDYNAWSGYGYSDALPGAGFFTWGAQRESYWRNATLNVYDVDDFDRDQVLATSDCNDADPGAIAAPALVSGLAMDKITGGVRLAWSSQASTAGSGTVYDLVSGGLSALRAEGGYGAASCVADDHTGAAYDDMRADPTAGDGYYYLIRAENSCATASYGDSSISPDPRDDLDATGPCP